MTLHLKWGSRHIILMSVFPSTLWTWNVPFKRLLWAYTIHVSIVTDVECRQNIDPSKKIPDYIFVLKKTQLVKSISLILFWNTEFFSIKHHIKWRGGGGQFCRELYDHEETTTYKTQSQIRNCMFLAPHLSTGASLNRIFGVKVIPEQSNKTWLFFQKKVVRTRLV